MFCYPRAELADLEYFREEAAAVLGRQRGSRVQRIEGFAGLAYNRLDETKSTPKSEEISSRVQIQRPINEHLC